MKYLFVLILTCFPGLLFCQDTIIRPELHLGGALRFDYDYSDWNPGHRKRGGDFGYDVFMLHPQASYKGFLLDADVRFYSTAYGGFMLRYGWIGYRFSDQDRIEVGLTKVPFGIQPGCGNNFFHQISFYAGLEEDADMGIKYVHDDERWMYAAAFFKNADELLFGPRSETSANRYGYDVGGRNKEINQWNVQVVYKFGTTSKNQVGISGEFGQLYNLDTRHNGTHFAFAFHYVLDWRDWNLKAQIAPYAMYPKNAKGEDRDVIVMTAYGSSYILAAKGTLYSLSFSHNFPLQSRWMQNILVYHDFGILQKWNSHFRNSVQNISGLQMTTGPVITYIDYAMGRHHAWLGPDWDAFGPGNPNGSWHTRFNINIGYYF